MILQFVVPFPARMGSKFAKSANMTQKIYLFLLTWLSEDAEFHAAFNSVKKIAEKLLQKNYWPKHF